MTSEVAWQTRFSNLTSSFLSEALAGHALHDAHVVEEDAGEDLEQ